MVGWGAPLYGIVQNLKRSIGYLPFQEVISLPRRLSLLKRDYLSFWVQATEKNAPGVTCSSSNSLG